MRHRLPFQANFRQVRLGILAVNALRVCFPLIRRTSWQAGRACLIFLFAALAIARAAAAAPDGQAIDRAVEQVYGSGQYQTELPKERKLELPQIKPLQLPQMVIEVLRVLFWTLIVVGVGLLLFYLARVAPDAWRRLRGEPRVASPVAATITLAAAEDVAAGDLAEIDSLARAGRYAEAVHALLLHGLLLLRQQLGLQLAPSLTSREILHVPALPQLSRQALEVIIAAVELCHFGARPADEALYRRCRERYQQIAVGARQ
jgi:hypothetical protein